MNEWMTDDLLHAFKRANKLVKDRVMKRRKYLGGRDFDDGFRGSHSSLWGGSASKLRARQARNADIYPIPDTDERIHGVKHMPFTPWHAFQSYEPTNSSTHSAVYIYVDSFKDTIKLYA